MLHRDECDNHGFVFAEEGGGMLDLDVVS